MSKLNKLFLFGLLSFSGTVFSQISFSKWQSQPIVIDGDGSDWGALPRFYNSASNIKYEFRNDAENLFIILKTSDHGTQMQLMRAGFSVKLKIKTTPSVKAIISFPALRHTEMPPMMNNQEGRTDKLVDKSITRPEIDFKDTAILEGFLTSKGIITSENKNEKSICFAKGKSKKELGTYEICIPLREILGSDFLVDNINNTPIQFQVLINELTQNEMTKMKDRMGGSHGGGMHGGGEGRGMGGMRGGEMGGGMMGGNRGEMPEGDMNERMQNGGMMGGFSMERKSFSIDFKLSNGK